MIRIITTALEKEADSLKMNPKTSQWMPAELNRKPTPKTPNVPPSDNPPFLMADDEKVNKEEEVTLPPSEPELVEPTPVEEELPPEEAVDVPEAVEPPPEAIPTPSEEPIEEAEPFEEVPDELTDLEKMNQSLSIMQKIERSLSEGYPLRIIYTTIKGHTTERTVRPDYFLVAKSTGNFVLIAWCELRNAWRGFIVDRIRAAKLENQNA